MANISTVTFQIDTDLKERTEAILSEIGITPSGVMEMVYEQIVLLHGMPFPVRKPTAIGGMTPEEIDMEIQKGIESANTEKLYTIDEVDDYFRRVYGV